jgi:hypothetical protein
VLDFWWTADEEVTPCRNRDSFDVKKLTFPVSSNPSFHNNLTASWL